MEHYDLLLDWLDDPARVRGQLVFRGMNPLDVANPLLKVGKTFWWGPDTQKVFLEVTHLDDIARHNIARARAAIPTLPPVKAGDKIVLVVWDDLGVSRVSTTQN